MKVGLIYTSTTPELIELVEQEVKKQLGDGVELLSLQDPSILAEVREAGYVTTAPAARLIGMYMKAAEEGVDAMLNLCSSVGEVADCVQDTARYIGVPIVRVDEEMCREAVRLGSRIGVMATLPTTLTPTKNTVTRVAREAGRHAEPVDCLVDGASAWIRSSSAPGAQMPQPPLRKRWTWWSWHREAWPMPSPIWSACMENPFWAVPASAQLR